MLNYFLATNNFYASTRIATFNLNLMPTRQFEQVHVGGQAWLGMGEMLGFAL